MPAFTFFTEMSKRGPYENTATLFYLMISGVMNGDPLEILEFRQHDWGSHH
jgi:hypothetical protein